MVLKYRTSESTISPVLVDTKSSKKVVYLRKDVQEKTRTNESTGETYTYYEYQEAKLTKDEYIEYLMENQRTDIDKQREDIDKQVANTDYLALMMGIDLDDTTEEV